MDTFKILEKSIQNCYDAPQGFYTIDSDGNLSEQRGEDIALKFVDEVLSESKFFNFTPIYLDLSKLVDEAGSNKNLPEETLNKYFGSHKNWYAEINSGGTLDGVIDGVIDIPYKSVFVRLDIKETNSIFIYGICPIDETFGQIVYYAPLDNKKKIPLAMCYYKIENNKIRWKTIFQDTGKFAHEYANCLCGHLAMILRTFERLSEYEENKKDLVVYSEKPNKDEKRRFICMGKGKSRKKVELPLKTIYIVLDEHKKHTVRQYAKGDRRVEYTCSWIVRGHYRRLQSEDSLGINRFTNERTESGRTWIESYMKGNQDLPAKRVLTTVSQRNPK